MNPASETSTSLSSAVSSVEETNVKEVCKAGISVSSLAEKFENIKDSATSEEQSIIEGKMDVAEGRSVSPSTESKISRIVEEELASVAERMSQSAAESDQSAEDSVTCQEQVAVSEQGSRLRKSSSQMSLKDLEKSLLTALDKTNSKSAESEETSELPRIKITEASDQEEATVESEDKTEVDDAEVAHEGKSSAETIEQLKTMPASENVGDKVSASPTTALQSDKNEVKPKEERKAIFYIASDDYTSDCMDEFSELSDELRQRSGRPTEPSTMEQSSDSRNPSCLCSKSVHGSIFLASALVAILGYILYNLAHMGKVPDFFQPIGLTTAIIAGIIGGFSLLCFSFLGAFPTVPFTMHEMINARNLLSMTRRPHRHLDEESWTSETERAFRRENNMSSSSDEMVRMPSWSSDRQNMLQKAKKLKRELDELLDSFSDMVAKSELGSSMENVNVVDSSCRGGLGSHSV